MMDTLINEKFNIMLKNRFSILQEETAMTIEDFNTAMMKSAKRDNRMLIDLQIQMDLARYMENDRR